MTDKWHENEHAQKWLKSLSTEQHQTIQKIVEDKTLLNQAISYGLEVAGYTGETAEARRQKILSSVGLSQSAAAFYLYQSHLAQSQISNQSPKQNHKENVMEQAEQKAERVLTEKQVNFAMNTRKPMFIESAKELVNFLEQQNDPQWWLDRKQFNWCVSSFVKCKAEEYYQQNPDKRPQAKQENTVGVTTNTQVGAQPIGQPPAQPTPAAQFHAEVESSGMKF